MIHVLVVGGAGYIGSHIAKYLVTSDYKVTVLDDLSAGDASSVKYGRLVVGSIANSNLLEKLFSDNKFDVVMHFAAHSLVAESIIFPTKYYGNNVSNKLCLLNMMIKHDVKNFVFSSTAAILAHQPIYQ